MLGRQTAVCHSQPRRTQSRLPIPIRVYQRANWLKIALTLRKSHRIMPLSLFHTCEDARMGARPDITDDSDMLFTPPAMLTPVKSEPGVAPPRPAELREAQLSLCVLGSGSGGNSTLVKYGRRAMLIDAGFGPLTTARRLGQAREALKHIRAICVTHLDQDHFRPTWIEVIAGWGIRIYIHHWHDYKLRTLEGARALYDNQLVHTFDTTPFEPIAGLTMSPIHLRHDTQGTSGFLGESDGGSFGYATDLGHVPPELVRRFAGVDLLAIECNYDPQMQQASTRPERLKRRIMGKAGHLSNQQAFDAARAIAAAGKVPRDIVLLHRSRQCNTPQKVMEVFSADPALASRVVLTEQRRRSRWFRVKPCEQGQLMLFGRA